MSKFDFFYKLLLFQFRKFGMISHKFLDKKNLKTSHTKPFTPFNFGSKWLKFLQDDYNMWENKVKKYCFDNFE